MPMWPMNGMNQFEAGEEKGERGRRRVDGEAYERGKGGRRGAK